MNRIIKTTIIGEYIYVMDENKDIYRANVDAFVKVEVSRDETNDK